MSAFWNGLRRALWRGLAPIHRPLIRRWDGHVNRLIDERLSAELEARLVPTLTAALETTAQTVNRLDSLIAHTNRATQETDQALKALLDEVIRLREQVEALHQLVPPTYDHHDVESDDLETDDASLAIVDQDESCNPFEVDTEEERARGIRRRAVRRDGLDPDDPPLDRFAGPRIMPAPDNESLRAERAPSGSREWPYP